jgi:hypothetical protein
MLAQLRIYVTLITTFPEHFQLLGQLHNLDYK